MEEQRIMVAAARRYEEAGRASASETEFMAQLQGHVAAGYRLAAVILGDRSEAEDATHDAIERAWRARGQLRDLEHFGAWFQRILVNSCRDRVRKRRDGPILLTISQAIGVAASMARPDDDMAQVAERDAIAHALQRIDIDRRVVIALRFYLDLEVEEIARRIGVPAGTVKSRLHRALKELRDAWEMTV